MFNVLQSTDILSTMKVNSSTCLLPPVNQASQISLGLTPSSNHLAEILNQVIIPLQVFVFTEVFI